MRKGSFDGGIAAHCQAQGLIAVSCAKRQIGIMEYCRKLPGKIRFCVAKYSIRQKKEEI